MAVIFQGEKTERTYRKIVSVVPSQTELLFDLGLNAEVIGITKFCIHPDEWFSNKTRVGGTKKLHLDTIRALQPDIVLANKEENLKEEIEAIGAFTDVYVSDIETLEDALQMIREIGSLTGTDEKAGELVVNIEKAFSALKILSQQRAAYFIWRNPHMSVGSDTFIHEMMRYAGFENVFADRKRYPEISMEILRDAQPDVVLLSSEPYPFKEEHIHELQKVLPDAKIILVDGEMFSWYGSRLLKAPRYFEDLKNN